MDSLTLQGIEQHSSKKREEKRGETEVEWETEMQREYLMRSHVVHDGRFFEKLIDLIFSDI
jgi:hypothetical protein